MKQLGLMIAPRPLLVPIWLIFCAASGDVLAVDSIAPDELREQARRCERLLLDSVVDFYLPDSVDQIHGGYLEELDAEGRFADRGQKFLTLQSRQLWLFSTLASEGVRRDASLAAARSGYEFLQASFLDTERGGYYSTVTSAGQPLDRRKHAYLNSFALYGLVAYYRATEDDQAIRSARRLFETLDENAHDDVYGGYQEFFHEDWQPVVDPDVSGYVGAIGTKTYNTHLHLLESFAALYGVWPERRVASRLAELVQINTNTVRHAKSACNIDGWSRDWQMVPTQANERASYGHDVECAWLVLDATRRLDWSGRLLRAWAESLCEYSLAYGYDARHGGFYYTGPVGAAATDRRKEWWVQAEAIVSMLEMYQLTGDERYYRVFAQTLDFVEQFQIADEGGWWATRGDDGRLLENRTRSSMWQGAYHNGRALLLCRSLLNKLAER